jgi:hypothetical protein
MSEIVDAYGGEEAKLEIYILDRELINESRLQKQIKRRTGAHSWADQTTMWDKKIKLEERWWYLSCITNQHTSAQSQPLWKKKKKKNNAPLSQKKISHKKI